MEDRVQLRSGARRQFLGLLLVLNIAVWFAVGVVAVRWEGVDAPSVVVLVAGFLLLVKFWRSGTIVSANGWESAGVVCAGRLVAEVGRLLR